MECLFRTIECGKVTSESISKTVVLSGWVDKRRDHGGLIFIDLRDRSGIMQIVINKDTHKNVHEIAQHLRSEYVISVTGKVVERAPGTINKELATGTIELAVDQLTILNKAHNLPFSIHEEHVDEELRLKYRYLDLRRPEMQRNLHMRHKIIFAMRQFLNMQNFYEIETPILTKNTAEGAREFLVPSRQHKGSFYALPQSPQLYKQLLMAGGIEKYFQIARCFRDEDLRADRQPEFTQLDMEMSFICETDIQNIVELLLKEIFKLASIDIKLPLERMTYEHAFNRYGSDKPDLRFDMPIYDVSKVFANTELSIFRGVLDKGGALGALIVKNNSFSRSELEHWVNQAIKNGAKGLVWVKFTPDGDIEAPIAKFLSTCFFDQMKEIIPNLTYADTIFIVAGAKKDSWNQLGKLRLQIGEKLNLIDKNLQKLLWITDFPLLEFDEKTKTYSSVHHPFTAPQAGWENLDPKDMKARAYDIVYNGVELGGGSIRIHNKELQEKVFDFLGLKKNEMCDHFGFLFEAQELGFPPHGGIALGIDRLVMLLLDLQSIREVIPFPKTQSGMDPMMNAPTPVDPKKLAEYGIKLLPQDN